MSAALGALVLAAAGVLALAPGVLPPEVLDPVTAVDVADIAETGLLAAAAVALLLGALGRVSIRALPRDPVSVAPRDESDRTVPISGVDFDAAVAEHDLYRRGATVPEPASEPGLTETLAATLARLEGCSEADARELLESGAWTDDRDAALLFATAPDSTAAERFRAWLRPEATFERRVRAATGELERLSRELHGVGNAERERDGGEADAASTDREVEAR
ncbi:DUF7269 family protein [Halorubrum lipolyticum]|uniref:DUF7269 family protein n=1 Tax=Halorubrum lipolyticum TaxID=368624 RepID=UPI000ABCBB36|nr:hypothetical protein [Halorubrum lipolyticum]